MFLRMATCPDHSQNALRLSSTWLGSGMTSTRATQFESLIITIADSVGETIALTTLFVGLKACNDAIALPPHETMHVSNIGTRRFVSVSEARAL